MPNVVDDLKAQIAANKITFDSGSADRLRKELLGVEPGITEKLQKLVLELAKVSPRSLRISSILRATAGSHHTIGRAVDIGNEEIASYLLPLVATNAQVAALGIDEIIFDAKVAGQSDSNVWNFDRGQPHSYDRATLNAHMDHIHFSVKA